MSMLLLADSNGFRSWEGNFHKRLIAEMSW